MDAGLRIDSYQWAGGREAMLRFGLSDGPTVVLALPLFEEANRTRAFGVTLLRLLAARGIGGVLPELPGQGESLVTTDAMTLADLRAAFAAVPGSHAIAIRSGALVVDARPAWLLAPQDGPALRRELARVNGGALRGERITVAGNLLSKKLLDDLASAALPGDSFHPGESRGPGAMSIEERSAPPGSPQLGPGLRRDGDRVIRLTPGGGPADLKLDGSALWRRAEPDNDIAFAQLLAADIAEWIANCAG